MPASHRLQTRRPVTERLERRRLLAGLLGSVPEQMTTTLNGIDSAMAGISDTIFQLPVIGQSATDIEEIRHAFREFSQPLRDALNAIDKLPAFVVSTVRNTIGDTLRGIDILGDHDGDTVVDNEDVSVHFTNLSNFSISFDLAKQFSVPIPSEELSLGLGSIPIGLRASSGASFSLTFAYENFRFGRNGGDFFFDTSTSRELSFTLGARLPQSMTVLLGVLMGTATNNTAGDNFVGTISADLNGMSVQSPRLGGVANFNLGIETAGIGITETFLPKIKTDLVVSWPFGSTNAGRDSSLADLMGSYGQFGAPTLAFNNVAVDIGPFLADIVGPIARSLTQVTQPLQDALDTLYSPIPGVSDLSEAVGGPKISLAEVAAFNGVFPPGYRPLPVDFENVLRATTKLREFSTLMNQTAGSLNIGSAYLPLGSFPISGPTAGSLLVNAAGQKLQSLIGGALNLNWSELLAGGVDLSYEQIVSTAVDLVGNVLGDDVRDLLTQLQRNLGLTEPDGVFFDYPIIKQTKDQLIGALLGKDVEFIRMHARWKNQQFGGNFVYPVGYLVGVVAQLEARPEIDIRMGLDSYGLKKAVSAAWNDTNLNPLDAFAIYAPQGVYIMSDSRVKVDAVAGIGAGLTAPGLTVAPVVNMTANLLAQMDVPNPNTARKIRPFDPTGELGSSIFRVSGSLTGNAGLLVEVGISPLVVSKTWNWASKTIFSFDSYPDGKVPNPFVSQTPPTLGSFETPGVLTLSMGNATRRSTRGVAVDAINERFTISEWYDNGVRTINVNAYGREQDFIGVTALNIQCDDGADVVTIDPSVTIPTVVFLGTGDDQLNYKGKGLLTALGENGNDKFVLSSRQGNIDVFGQDGNDDFTIDDTGSSAAARYINIEGGNDDDHINIGSTFRSGINVIVNGGAGSDQVSLIAESWSPIFGYSNPNAVSVNGGPNIAGDVDSILLQNIPDWVPLVGGGVSLAPSNDRYLVTDATIRRQTSESPFDINYANVQRIQINMSGGDDEVIVTASNRDVILNMGEGDDRFIAAGTNNTYRVFGESGDDLFNLWGGVVNRTSGHSQLLGGPGIDSIEYDVSFSSSSSWNITNSSVSIRVDNGPTLSPQNGSIQSDGWEGVRFTGTTGSDQVIVGGSIPFNLYINTRGGDDNVLFNEARNPFQVFVNNNIGVDLGGQAGDLFQALTDLDQNRFLIDSEGFKASRDNDLALIRTLRVTPLLGIGTFNLVTSDIDDVIDIDASFDPNRSYMINSLGGADSLSLRNFGALTRPGTINTGDGFDSLTFDDSLIGTPRDYSILSGVMSPQSAPGAFPGNLAFSAAEQVLLRTGSASDRVRVNGGASGVTYFSILTGEGDDWVYGESTIVADFGSFLTGVSMGEGDDRFSLRNVASSAATPWTFTITTITGGNGLIPANIFHFDTERFEFDGGSGADSMNIAATDDDQRITLRAGAGDDTYSVYDTATRRTDSIRSLITIHDSAGNDTLRADNAGKPDTGDLGDWIHITEGVLSHTTNDRFFAPGGRVVHSGINLLQVQTSQAVDYAVVTPSPNYFINVYDSNIVNASQDNIFFSLAGVVEPQYIDLFTISRLQSANRQNVDVSGYEFATLGTEVPVVTTPPTPVFDATVFYLNLTFDVPMDIFTFGSGEAFTVQNLTTGHALPVGSMLATDNGVNGFFITFPGYENGLPPDGRYRITLSGDYVRSVNYNPMGIDHSSEFDILRGDADHNGIVDFSDLLILAQNYGQSGRTFSQGNFDYSADGSVTFSDLLILAQRYNVSLQVLPWDRRRTPRVGVASDVLL